MYGYGGLARYYANRNFDTTCKDCSGKGHVQHLRDGQPSFSMTCGTCNGSGHKVVTDYPVPRKWWALLIAAILVGGTLTMLGVGFQYK